MQLGLAPSEFWRMSPGEFWWWVKAKAPDAFNGDDWQELYEALG